MKKITSLEREEMKKREKDKKGGEEDSNFRSLIWIKYTLGLKHQVILGIRCHPDMDSLPLSSQDGY